MEFRTTGLLSSSSDGTEPESSTIATVRHQEAPSRSKTVDTNDQLEHLAQSELMLRTAIEALSPDKDEILEGLSGAEGRTAEDGRPPLNFGLILVAVVLLFLILALDLLMAGG